MKNIISALILLASTLTFGQIDSTDIIVNKIMTEQKIVGLSLAVIKNGTPLVNKGYGLANVEHNVPVTPETVMRLGSVSKQFVTTAILKLVEEGKITINDSVYKFFPGAPKTWKPILIKHLMSHTSGLKREAPGYKNTLIQPDLTVIKSAYNLPLDFKAGEKYQYSNLGYFMLAEIIKQVTKIRWEDYIVVNLFAPSGMTTTAVTDYYTITPNRASGYIHKDSVLMNADVMYAIRPSGGFHSTTSDMILWDKVIREKKTILKKESWELLWKPFIKTNNDPNAKCYSGFGWMIDEHKGHRLIGHGGVSIGYKSHYARFIDDDLAIIVLTNTDEADPSALVWALSDYYFRESNLLAKNKP